MRIILLKYDEETRPVHKTYVINYYYIHRNIIIYIYLIIIIIIDAEMGQVARRGRSVCTGNGPGKN